MRVRLFSIQTLASRGWLTVFLALLGLFFSIILMSYGVFLGKILMQTVIAVFPFGVYEIYRGRGKYKYMSLAEYKTQLEQNKESKIYLVLGIVRRRFIWRNNRLCRWPIRNLKEQTHG